MRMFAFVSPLTFGKDPKPPASSIVAPVNGLRTSGRYRIVDLGAAIDTAFARWDLSHLHLFELESGMSLMLGGGDDGEPDSESVPLASLTKARGRFVYVYDLGDGWRHECEVMEVGVDPREAYGTAPAQPVPIFGWGTIPDQYGRLAEVE